VRIDDEPPQSSLQPSCTLVDWIGQGTEKMEARVRIELTRKGFADLEVVPLTRLFSLSSLALVVFCRNFVVPTRHLSNVLILFRNTISAGEPLERVSQFSNSCIFTWRFSLGLVTVTFRVVKPRPLSATHPSARNIARAFATAS
jgi:hypothetical protein